MPEDLKPVAPDELSCWVDPGRVCGADCMAYEVGAARPGHAWRACRVLRALSALGAFASAQQSPAPFMPPPPVMGR